MFNNTLEGEIEPLEQADPSEANTFCLSKEIFKVSHLMLPL